MSDQPHRAFPMIGTPAERSHVKPRKRGQTMMVDWGLPLRRLEDLLDMCGDYLDLAKFAVGSVRVYEERQLVSKLALYRDHGVRCFIGGGIGERLFALDGRDALPRLFAEARRVGFEAIEVSDNGCGMDEQFVRERLFRPFDTTKGSKGMGIGAYQTREFVRASGGDVQVHSQPGTGTRFIIRLPLAGASANMPDEPRPEIKLRGAVR